MVSLYIGEIKVLAEEAVFQKYYEKIDAFRQDKVRQCKKEADKKRSLLAGYLLQAGIKDVRTKESGLPMGAAPLSLSYAFGGNGKPYLLNEPHIYFNISHSGDYVICAISEEEVGADIQEHRQVKQGLVERFFSREENELLKEHNETQGITKEELFYRIWAVKEAHMKLTGKGMAQGLYTTAVEFESPMKGGRSGIIRDKSAEKKDAYFHICDNMKKYSIAVCCYSKITDINIREILLT